MRICTRVSVLGSMMIKVSSFDRATRVHRSRFWHMLSVGIAQYPVPGFRLPEQFRAGWFWIHHRRSSCLGRLPRCQL
jgi:hypothetical protein